MRSALNFAQIAGSLAVATNPYRLQILYELAPAPTTTEALFQRLTITKSAVSQHLTVLRLLGLIESRRVGYTMEHRLLTDHPVFDRLARAVPELFEAA